MHNVIALSLTCILATVPAVASTQPGTQPMLSAAEKERLFERFQEQLDHPVRTRPAPIPSEAGHPRIVIHVPPTAAAEDRARRLAGTIGAEGDHVEVRQVGASPAQASVRYFHPDDQAAARTLAARLSGRYQLQDFTTFRPLPSHGTIEVWLPQG